MASRPLAISIDCLLETTLGAVGGTGKQLGDTLAVATIPVPAKLDGVTN